MNFFGLVVVTGLVLFGGDYVSCDSNFVATCSNIGVEHKINSYWLTATCQSNGFYPETSALDLGLNLENDNGTFRVKYEGLFGLSAKNVSVIVGESSCMLRAQLLEREDNYAWAAFPLDRYVANIDGQLTW